MGMSLCARVSDTTRALPPVSFWRQASAIRSALASGRRRQRVGGDAEAMQTSDAVMGAGDVAEKELTLTRGMRRVIDEGGNGCR
jgi:hypothetical protein